MARVCVCLTIPLGNVSSLSGFLPLREFVECDREFLSGEFRTQTDLEKAGTAPPTTAATATRHPAELGCRGSGTAARRCWVNTGSRALCGSVSCLSGRGKWTDRPTDRPSEDLLL
ncbi:hypothetical protein F2P81_024489 [Scophthalmus maximus]|uniref:Uncharacterized protein n=1 Tax=Scophthalmus maximus TaxID=52904 RepID=A0A6A4RUB7_SCOMX|nr:hypothetical protein F2P81_024489 [Scophthalmus maximus]